MIFFLQYIIHSSLLQVQFKNYKIFKQNQSYLWNHLTQRDLPCIFKNDYISAFQNHLQIKFYLHISIIYSLLENNTSYRYTLYVTCCESESRLQNQHIQKYLRFATRITSKSASWLVVFGSLFHSPSQTRPDSYSKDN